MNQRAHRPITLMDEADLAELLEEYEDRELEIMSEFNDKAQAVERYEVGLDKSDISVDDVALVWIRR